MIEDLWTHGQQEIDAWKAAPLADLLGHIVGRYHLEARLEMARMENLAAEAGVLLDLDSLPQLLGICMEVGRFCRQFRSHLAMEEHNLFPWLLDPRRGWVAGADGELMPPLIKTLEEEHESEAGLFGRLHLLAAGLALPAPAHDLQVRLAQSFQAMERSLQRHILLENQALFRRVS